METCTYISYVPYFIKEADSELLHINRFEINDVQICNALPL